MKILMVNKYYYIKGGSERYFFELKKTLEDHGHTVIPFAMKSRKNFQTPFEKYFVNNIEFNLNSYIQKLYNSIRITARILYSLHARRKLERLLRENPVDVAHLHMIEHQISPSILHSLRKFKVPVILTAHQSKLICPNYRLFNWRKMQVCEKCLGGKFYHPIIERCHKNSLAASTLISIESYFHKWIRIYENNIDIIHVPSKFFQKKFIQAGISPQKVEQLYYTINIDEYITRYGGDDYFLVYGRLEEAKGLLTILKAMRTVKKSRLMIAGEGPYRAVLENFIRKNSIKNAELVGYKKGDDLKKIIANSQFVIIASECYDNSPLVVYESFSSGKPVIGANIGGIPELIDHGKNGFLFAVGNEKQLSERINQFLGDKNLTIEMGKNARQTAERRFSPEVHYEEIIKKYQRLLEIRNK